VTEERFSRLVLGIILKEFVLKTGRLQLSLDHPTFGRFTLAVFARCVVAGKGHKLLKPLLRGFRTLLDHLSYQQRKRLAIVMDRWFDIPDLLTWLDDNGLKFVVRLKTDR
jgi:hypothetical protein